VIMARKEKEYRRLPGRGRHLSGTSTLWLGPDHLLRVEDVASRLGHGRRRENRAGQHTVSDSHNSSAEKFLLQD